MTRPRILVVEDELIVAEDLKMTLASLGYDVAGVTGTGEGAIDLAEKTRPDLILMDIMLAGELDGISTADRIQKILSVPVIYVTAYAGEALITRAKSTKPFGYIVKPFNEREVRSNIEIALYRHRMEQETKKRDAVLLVLTSGLEWFLRQFAERYCAVLKPSGTPPGKPAARPEYFPFLENIGNAMDLSRIAVFRYDSTDAEALSLVGEWVGRDTVLLSATPAAKMIDTAHVGLAAKMPELRGGSVVVSGAGDPDPVVRDTFSALKFTSAAVLEIAVRNEPYGLVFFVDAKDRTWPSEERDAMRIAADLLGSAIGLLAEPCLNEGDAA